MPKVPITDSAQALSRGQVVACLNAGLFAFGMGKPLNAQLVIRWGLLPNFMDDQLPQLQTRLMDRLARWLGRQGIALHGVWVRERARGVGLHTHLLLHLPEVLETPLASFLTASFGFVDEDRLGGSSGVHVKVGGGSPKAVAGLMRYALKGVDHRTFVYLGNETENLGVMLGIDHRGTQGIIEMKRCGASQNLGLAARRQAGWQEVRDLNRLGAFLRDGTLPSASARHVELQAGVAA